jgi:glycosyltransferase involved in cell wall biosynthesis
MRVLHLPSTVGGNAQGLSRHLRALGVDSASWTFQQTYFNYPCDRVLWSHDDGPLAREFKRIAAIFQAALIADVIHFNFGTTLAWPTAARADEVERPLTRWRRRLLRRYWDVLQAAEFRLYRAAGIRMFVHYQGDDARQGDRSRAFRISIAANVGPDYYDEASDRFKRRMIGRMARFCDAVYTVNPDLLHVLPPGSRFVPYSHIALEEWCPSYPDASGTAPLRVGHAPSHRGVKGTEAVIRAVEELRAEGHRLELVLVEGVSHQAARKLYEGIDVLVDQLYAGWYGGVAVEAMALGKPVLVYIRHEDLDGIPDAMRGDLPFIEVEAGTLRDRLRGVVRMPRTELHRLGRASRSFVERWHDPRRIAAEIKADYESALRQRGAKTGQACRAS